MSESTLLEELLQEQHTLSAVDRFSRVQPFLSSGSYSQLLPATPPAAHQQYAFVVQLDLCTGCKACVTACHSLNGLDPDENWRDTGILQSVTEETPYQQTITTACHHCADPACLNGCPVAAYEKDTHTGAVRHLDDQCIGCQYCILKCPYDVPKYSSKRGIVRKCDLCSQRLVAGEAPACVQACPSSAISIQLVDRTPPPPKPLESLLPGVFPSHYTRPTTQYLSKKPIPQTAVAADARIARTEPAHLPLVVMLVLTQLAVGLFVVTPFYEPASQLMLSASGWIFLHLGLGCSVLHLGRPLGAWRFFLGLRTSWMSREILAFAVLSGVSTFQLVVFGARLLPLDWRLPELSILLDPFRNPLLLIPLCSFTALLGLVAVFTSAMIYIDTQRPAWGPAATFFRFFSSVFILGAGGTATVLGWTTSFQHSPIVSQAVVVSGIAILIRLCQLLWEERFSENPPSGLLPVSSGQVLNRAYPWLKKLQRTLLLAATSSTLSALLFPSSQAVSLLSTSFLFLLASQILDRTVFFTTATSPRMPGMQ